MVAVLEIGAFSMAEIPTLTISPADVLSSYLGCCWTSGGYHWPKRDVVCWSSGLQCRWCHTDTVCRLLDDGAWTAGKRLWCWWEVLSKKATCLLNSRYFRTSFVRAAFPLSNHRCSSYCYRTIVPIYQSEISPPNHVCQVPTSRVLQASRLLQRGALAW